MKVDIPFLLNHDASKPIGVWRKDGVGEFNPEQRITREMLFEMLGGAGVRIIESFAENGQLYVRAFEIIEFSLCGTMVIDEKGVVRDFFPFDPIPAKPIKP